MQFKNGLDWQAFSLSFSKLIIENEDAGMVVQGIDIKEDGVVIVKVKLDSDADKVKFHQSFMQGYELAQKTLEPQYQRRELQYERSLQDKSETLNHLFFLVQKYQEQLGEVPKLMAENSKPITNQTTINTSTIGFVQSGSGTISNFSQNIGQNADEIVCLINSLRSIAQVFPEVEREEVAMHLDDLQNDISQPEKRTPARIKTRIVALWAVACTLAVGIAGVADFSNNVLELAEKLGVPIEFSQSQTIQQLPPSP